MKKSTVFAGFALSALLALPLAAQDAPTAATIVATVNGSDITLGELIVARANLPPEYQAMPDDALFEGLLDQLVQQRAMEATYEGKLTLKDELTMAQERRAYISSLIVQDVAAKAITPKRCRPPMTPALPALCPPANITRRIFWWTAKRRRKS